MGAKEGSQQISKASGLSDRKGEGTIYKDGEEYGKCRIRDGSAPLEMPAGFLSGESQVGIAQRSQQLEKGL